MQYLVTVKAQLSVYYLPFFEKVKPALGESLNCVLSQSYLQPDSHG